MERWRLAGWIGGVSPPTAKPSTSAGNDDTAVASLPSGGEDASVSPDT